MKPKILYRYNTNHRMDALRLNVNIVAEISMKNSHGDLWWAKGSTVDFYGYKSKAEAISELSLMLRLERSRIDGVLAKIAAGKIP